MTAAAIAATAGIAGVVLGFFVRWGEFRREQRFAVYSSFLSAFLELMDTGSDTGRDQKEPAALTRQFYQQALRARMVQTRHVAPLLDEAEAMVKGRAAGRDGDENSSGSNATRGHRASALDLAMRIADKARRDVSGFGLPI